MNELDSVKYKKNAKLELFFFSSLVLGVVIYYLFLLITNEVSKHRYDKLRVEIFNNEQIIKTKSTIIDQKRQVRRKFWDMSNNVINLTEFDYNIDYYWTFMLRNKDDASWLNKFYSQFSSYNFDEFKIANPKDLYKFIEENNINADDNSVENEVDSIKKRNIDLQNKTVIFYDEDLIARNVFVVFVCLFGLFYILRPLFFFIKSMLSEIK